jgi:hypothetical protein
MKTIEWMKAFCWWKSKRVFLTNWYAFTSPYYCPDIALQEYQLSFVSEYNFPSFSRYKQDALKKTEDSKILVQIQSSLLVAHSNN